jgi:SRSO17 transposase
MLPAIETVSQNEILPTDVQELASELETYQAIYADCFCRREQREKSRLYLQGLLQQLPNKSIETMMLHNQGNDPNSIRAMQHFISQGAWRDEEVLARHAAEVDRDLGDEAGVLIVDGSDFPKQGEDSVGVKRQWCGELGKVANCQAGVYLGYASQHGYTLLDRRLYMPREWLEEAAYAQRRQQCGVPADLLFKKKQELAADMVLKMARLGSLRYRWLTCDEGFSRDTAFLDSVAPHVWYLAEVPENTAVWLKQPRTEVPAWAGHGRKPSRLQLAQGEPDSQSVLRVAQQTPAAQWQRYTIKEGAKGPLLADFVARRVINARDNLPGHEVWLLCRRDVLTDQYKFYLSNAPVAVPLVTFARVTGMRWPIETCFEEGKQELGLGDYQVRSWVGWHHHMTLCILAHFFLVRVQRRLKEKAPNLTLPQAILLLKSVLPQPKFDVNTTIEIVNYYQRRHEAAYQSHRKRHLALLEK